MRVLHFYKTSFPDTFGGIEQVIHQVARGAAAHGVQSDVLSLSGASAPDTLATAGYRSHRARLDLQVASMGVSATAFPRFARLARHADVIHYHFPWPFMDVVHFATGVRKPTVVTYHSDIVRQKHLLKLYRPLQWRFLNAMDRIIATSPNYVASSDVLRRYEDKVDVIPIGLDKASYPQPGADRLRSWAERLGPRFFLFVGVIRYYKGLHVLLEAARGTGIPIAIVGGGPLEAELKAQAARLGLDHVHFLGPLPDEDKVALLQLCDGLVFPSHLRSEAFGISLLEAAMYGKPMISCEIGTGTTYINVDGETGLVVPPDDAPALRQAMRRLWDDPGLAAALGRKAEARYQALFTADHMVRDHVRLYRRLAPSAAAR